MNARDFYQQQSDQREESRIAFLTTLAGQVWSIEERVRAGEDLLGEIIATLSIQSNRDNIRNGIGVENFLSMADRWKVRFDKLKQG